MTERTLKRIILSLAVLVVIYVALKVVEEKGLQLALEIKQRRDKAAGQD